MKQVAVDAEFDACGIQPGVETTEIDATADCGCVVGLQDRIDRRLELWSNLKREAPLMFQPSEDAESHHLTAVFREASLDAINRAMHHDMYLVRTITRTHLTSYSSISKYTNL